MTLHTEPPLGWLGTDETFLALLIGAMEASGHVSAEEAARTHNIIWSMRRFRHKPGEIVGREIEEMRTLVGRYGAPAIVAAAARAIPARLRPTAFAIAADLVLVDGKIERLERRFLDRLGTDLRLDRDVARRILDVMVLKNRG